MTNNCGWRCQVLDVAMLRKTNAPIASTTKAEAKPSIGFGVGPYLMIMTIGG